jgi:hypothetical protein
LKRGRRAVAIEVKSTRRLPRAATSGLRAIVDLPGIVRRVLVYTGTRRARTGDGVEIWPVRAFVEALEESSLWP